ncbi:MAG: YkgJ family cysteine cluster protein [Planctomycetota bacterium]|nr:YkgJ family cysteine cluster protein [Planctomycetota bacterium]
MPKTNPEMKTDVPGFSENLRQWVSSASVRPEVRRAVRQVYEDLEREIAERRPLCVLSGKCCRFDEYGHRLYVTTLELATFSHDLATGASKPSNEVDPSPLDKGVCPFQSGKLCGVHGIRPMGCRIFYCDPTSTQWQQERYEQFHKELKALHEKLVVPYLYVEWRLALEVMELTRFAPPAPRPVEKPESF